jgi:hypothetical protein
MRDRRHREDHGLGGRPQGQPGLVQGGKVGAAGDEHDVVAGLVEAAPDRAADAAGPVDEESHATHDRIPAAAVRRRLLRCALLLTLG